MKLKETEKTSSSENFWKILRTGYKAISSKKTKILAGIVIIFILLFIGIIIGLVISGVFGTFNQPSQLTLDVLHSMDITNLRDVKRQIEGIMAENIKIPVNYIKGKFAKTEKISIDIAFKDYQKLEYKRMQAIEQGILISSGDDYVPAKIKYNGKELDAKIRLKGDWTDHLEGNKWSFRIKLNGEDTLFGLKTFSIQDPKTRNYVDEYIYHQALKKEDVLALDYKFIEVTINGENRGVYAFEEHFEKQLIENNNGREGVIIKFNEDGLWADRLQASGYFSDYNEYIQYMGKKDLEWFYNSNIESFDDDKILADPILSKQLIEARNLLGSFRNSELKTSDVFDVEKLAKYFAVNKLLGAEHASEWTNIRFYYNPVTSLLEPIGFDAVAGIDMAEEEREPYLPKCLGNGCIIPEPDFHDLIFKDSIFFRKYVQELERISDKSYLDNLFSDLGKSIQDNINVIHKDNAFYHFSNEVFYENQIKIKSLLSPVKSINADIEEFIPEENKIIVSIGNIEYMPLEITSASYNSTEFNLDKSDNILQPRVSLTKVNYENWVFIIPDNFELKEEFLKNLQINYKIYGAESIKHENISVLKYWNSLVAGEDFIRKPANIRDFEFVEVDEANKQIKIKGGKWTVNKDMIIPKGYNVVVKEGTIIDIINNAVILSYSDLQFVGTREKPIRIYSSDKTGEGISVLSSERKSNLNYVEFNDLTNPSKNGWELSGAINFYESPVVLNNVIIDGMGCEDSLNIIKTKFEIKSSIFSNCFTDCFDDDFSEGTIRDSEFINCGGDCIDVSGADVKIDAVKIFGMNDKGVSAGEKSNMTIENSEINGNESNVNYIGIASKDKSNVLLKNVQISNVQYGIAVYMKKAEYGAAFLTAENTIINNAEKSYIIEKDSEMSLNGAIVLDKKPDVYKMLYGDAE